jgi:hypothetical protein
VEVGTLSCLDLKSSKHNVKKLYGCGDWLLNRDLSFELGVPYLHFSPAGVADPLHHGAIWVAIPGFFFVILLFWALVLHLYEKDFPSLSLFSFHSYSLCEGLWAYSSRWAKFKGQTINDTSILYWCVG